MASTDVKAVAGVILNEVPVAKLGSFVASAAPGQNAMGQGCGAGCATAGPDAIDRAGTSGITQQQLHSAFSDKAALKTELSQQIQGHASAL